MMKFRVVHIIISHSIPYFESQVCIIIVTIICRSGGGGCGGSKIFLSVIVATIIISFLFLFSLLFDFFVADCDIIVTTFPTNLFVRNVTRFFDVVTFLLADPGVIVNYLGYDV